MSLFKQRRKATKSYRYGALAGVAVGTICKDRAECNALGLHGPTQAGIHGGPSGAYSVVLSGGYEDDEDDGDTFSYTGEGGRKGANGPQIQDQDWKNKNNKSLKISAARGDPVRVIRGHTLKSAYAPEKGYRYDGIYRVTKAYQTTGKSGYKLCKFRFVRQKNQPPIPVRSTSSKGRRPVYSTSPEASDDSDSTSEASSDDDDKMEGSSRRAVLHAIFSSSSSSPSPEPERSKGSRTVDRKRKRSSDALADLSDADSVKNPKCPQLHSKRRSRASSSPLDVKSEEVDLDLLPSKEPLESHVVLDSTPSLPPGPSGIQKRTVEPVTGQDGASPRPKRAKKLKELGLGRIPKRRKIASPSKPEVKKVVDDGGEADQPERRSASHEEVKSKPSFTYRMKIAPSSKPEIKEVIGDRVTEGGEVHQPERCSALHEEVRPEPSFTYRGLLPSSSISAPVAPVAPQSDGDVEEGEVDEDGVELEISKPDEGQIEEGEVAESLQASEDESPVEDKRRRESPPTTSISKEMVVDDAQTPSADACPMDPSNSSVEVRCSSPKTVPPCEQRQHDDAGTRSDGNEGDQASSSMSFSEFANNSAGATLELDTASQEKPVSSVLASTPSTHAANVVYYLLPERESTMDWTALRNGFLQLDSMDASRRAQHATQTT